MVRVDLKADFKEVRDKIDELGDNSKKIQKSVLSYVGTKARNAARKTARIHMKSGNTYKSLIRKLSRDGKSVSIFSYAFRKEGATKYKYPFFLSNTYEIKSNTFLQFNINGAWIRKKAVQIKAINQFGGAGDYIQTSLSSDIQKKLQEYTSKIMEKNK